MYESTAIPRKNTNFIENSRTESVEIMQIRNSPGNPRNKPKNPRNYCQNPRNKAQNPRNKPKNPRNQPETLPQTPHQP